ncbi:MAG: C69 family dipeptidase [Anaerolineae bacterium]
MCDTLVALGNATVDGSVMLAKNSDREPNEAHAVLWQPRLYHDLGSTVSCTYRKVPQVRETHQVLLCKPFWMWGCEMGANDQGVAIGNEAVFTKEPYADDGLLGMDMMRLALERADTAERALEVITHLLAEYGQGGIGGYRNQRMRYHNAFLIADRLEAWVLETAGRYWAAEKVRDVRAISNGLTIGETWDLASPGLVEHARERGWCKPGDTFSFRECYSDWFYTTFSKSRARQSRATSLLREHRGGLTPQHMMAFLRDHGQGGGRTFDPRQSSMASICMHAANPLTRASQTTCSLVAHLGPSRDTFWVTGTSSPCLSVFKPVFLTGVPFPDMGPEPGARRDDAALWWRHEALHRLVLRDYPSRAPLIQGDGERLEEESRRAIASLDDTGARVDPRRLAELSERAFRRADLAMDDWMRRVAAAPRRSRPFSLYERYWRRQDKDAT